jgi:hypothetical protein
VVGVPEIGVTLLVSSWPSNLLNCADRRFKVPAWASDTSRKGNRKSVATIVNLIDLFIEISFFASLIRLIHTRGRP